MANRPEDVLDIVVCPGCGWYGADHELSEDNTCPQCGYENGVPPYRLFTLKEMLDREEEYNDVRMDRFLASVFFLLSKKEEGTNMK